MAMSSDSHLLSQGSSAAGTQGGRKSLANSLLPSQSVEFIINHDIKELGIHILVCSVHYTPAPAVGSVPTGHDRERKFFRKFYKFQVLNPLSVKTKVNTLADGRIFLEAQVQNVSSTSMYLERMNFEPNEPFLLVNLNQFPCAADAKGVDLNEDKEPHANAVDSQDLMLQTSQLSRKTPLVDPFEVSVISQPDVIKAEQPFKIKIRITNHMPGDRLKLSIHGFKSKMTTVLLRGPNDIELEG
ncbi:hypothetical protein BSLG_003828 [Batrachochytrium salamandrivorans]|nr:hypothetical protein BSLG_003828 [Batrachochytrium salamandrivorans]